MMSEKICRLCLRSENLIDIFACPSESTARLKMCISLATGISICQQDDVSRNVCLTCIRVTVMLYKFRKNALANDKALKEHVNKQLKLSRSANDEDFNQNLLDLLETSVEVSSFKSHSSPIQLTNATSNFEALNEVLTLPDVKSDDSCMLSRPANNPSTFKRSNVKSPNSNENRDTSLCYRSDNDMPIGSLLTKLDEEPVFTCDYCNKMFKAKSDLKRHRDAHRLCCLCNGIFQSQEALNRHQREICFKKIAANSPRVLLRRIDGDSEKPKLQLRQSRTLGDPNLTPKAKEDRPQNLINDLIAYVDQMDEGESDFLEDLFTPEGIKNEPVNIGEPSTVSQENGILNKPHEYEAIYIKYEESIVKEENASADNLFTSEVELKPDDLITHILNLLKKYSSQKQNLNAKKLRI